MKKSKSVLIGILLILLMAKRRLICGNSNSYVNLIGKTHFGVRKTGVLYENGNALK